MGIGQSKNSSGPNSSNETVPNQNEPPVEPPVSPLDPKEKNKIMTEEERYKAVLESVKGGDDKAKTKLAWYKLSGDGGCEIDTNGAVALLEERLKEDDTEAMWMLGVCNEFGRGCEQDLSRAEELYEQSSEGGNEIGRILVENKDEEHSRGSGYLRGGLQCSYKHWFIVMMIEVTQYELIIYR